MSRLSMKWIVFTVFLAAFLAAPVLAQRSGSGGPVIQSPESEPNDDFDTATFANMRELTHGKIGKAGDVDIYMFYSYAAGLPFTVDVRLPGTSPLAAVASLYDFQRNILAQASCTASPCLSLMLPADLDAPLFLVIEDENGAGGRAYEYAVWLDIIDADEPNDFPSQAIPITIGQTVESVANSSGDVDIYSINLLAGRRYYLPPFSLEVDLLDSEGDFDSNLFADWGSIFTVEEDGRYFLRVYMERDFNPGNGWSTYSFKIQEVNEPVYFSFQKKGSVGGVDFQPADILRYDPLFDTWSMVFQAADVELKGNVVAFDREDSMWGRLLLVFPAVQNVPGVGRVTPQDVVMFSPTSTGMDTAGTFELWMDGSDMGLSGGSESIDGLAFDNYTSPTFTTRGAGKVPTEWGTQAFKKNDIMYFYLWQTGPDTIGNVWLHATGAFLGLGSANIIGWDLSDSGKAFMVLDKAVTLDGTTYAAGNVVSCYIDGFWDSPCRLPELYFDVAAAGLGKNKIDAISVGSPEFYPQP